MLFQVHDIIKQKFIWPPLLVLKITQLLDKKIFGVSSKKERTAYQRFVFLPVSKALAKKGYICRILLYHITQGTTWRSCKSKDRQYIGLKCKDTNGVIRSCKSKDRQYTGLKCKNTNGVIRSCKWKDILYTGLKCKNTNGDIRSCKSKDILYTGLKCKNTNGSSEAVNQRTDNTLV
jgi:hypothetical protein